VKPDPSYYAIPKHWNGERNGEQLQTKGAATYRMYIHLQSSEGTYGLRLSNIRMASAVYVNGELVGSSGVPALTREEYVYENRPYTALFHLDQEVAEIVIHVANYDFVQGGVPNSIYFGDAEAIHRLDRSLTTRSTMIVMALMMLGVYHLCIFAVRRSDRGLLYFGLYCITLGLSFFTNVDRAFMLFFDLPPAYYYKIMAGSLFLTLLYMALILKHTCAGLIPDSDVFHGMISSKVYKDAAPFHEALVELEREAYNALDPTMTRVFINKFMSTLIGHSVKLTDGREGKIVLIQPMDPLRPLLQVGEQFIDLSKDFSLNISRIQV